MKNNKIQISFKGFLLCNVVLSTNYATIRKTVIVILIINTTDLCRERIYRVCSDTKLTSHADIRIPLLKPSILSQPLCLKSPAFFLMSWWLTRIWTGLSIYCATPTLVMVVWNGPPPPKQTLSRSYKALKTLLVIWGGGGGGLSKIISQIEDRPKFHDYWVRCECRNPKMTELVYSSGAKIKPWFHDIKAIYRSGVMWFQTLLFVCVCDIIN